MSFTATFLPILAALNCGENFLHIQQPWQAINLEQKTFMEAFYPYKNQLDQLSPAELESLVSLEVEEINQFLTDHHFNIQLDKGPDGSAYVASILDVLVHWIEKGKSTQLKANDQTYPAIELQKYYNVLVAPMYKHAIIEIKTDSGDYVYMTIADRPLESIELLNRIHQIYSNICYDATDHYSSVVFPMVDLNQRVDISWLIGIHTIGVDPTTGLDQSYEISQALQQTKFQMNEEGAAAQSAVAIAITKTALIEPKQPLIIDKPFYLWIMRDGVSLPLFAGYIDTNDWKKPKKLGI